MPAWEAKFQLVAMGFRKQGYFLTISVISVSSSSSCDFKGAISLSVMLYMKKKKQPLMLVQQKQVRA